MKLHNSGGPNPRVVRMFMAEKGIEMELVQVDLIGGENRREPYLSRNPFGQCPTLELDNGSHVAEITAICEYLDEVKTDTPSLIGNTPEERAQTRMWTHRVEIDICEPLSNGFRFSQGLKLFKDRVHCIPEAADGLKVTARENLAKLDKLMDGKRFVTGKRLTIADILLFGFLDYRGFGLTIDSGLKSVSPWYERMKARPSAAA